MLDRPEVLNFQGFSNGIDWWGGDKSGKMAKNCIKMESSAFLGQNRGDIGGQANFLTSERIPPVPPY